MGSATGIMMMCAIVNGSVALFNTFLYFVTKKNIKSVLLLWLNFFMVVFVMLMNISFDQTGSVIFW